MTENKKDSHRKLAARKIYDVVDRAMMNAQLALRHADPVTIDWEKREQEKWADTVYETANKEENRQRSFDPHQLHARKMVIARIINKVLGGGESPEVFDFFITKCHANGEEYPSEKKYRGDHNCRCTSGTGRMQGSISKILSVAW